MTGYFEFMAMLLILVVIICLVATLWLDSPVMFFFGVIGYVAIAIAMSSQRITYRNFTNPAVFNDYMRIYMSDVLMSTVLVSDSGKPITYVFDKNNRTKKHNFVIAKLAHEQSEVFASQLYSLALSHVEHIPSNVRLTSNVKYLYNDDNEVKDVIITINIIPKE